ncbi:MAG TPA: LacI family DNA-binding transcriptional regulator [Devosiaceae bacterium]|jgi:LacI family gluconate utilization system Gnt-I transcriptional repressor|nr:LacI family DNA-binding transcriptional regulator [Devosiaceae bacterium]
MGNSNRTKTLKDVSRASGLSLITVSRALRLPETVQAETRARVYRAIEEIGYVPNLTARSLVSSRSNMIGVVVPILSSSLFADFAQGVAAVLQREKLQMLLGVSERSVELETEAVRTFVGRQADAIIVTGFTHSESCRTVLSDFGGPIVETWNLRDDAIDIAVGYDNVKASSDMTRYLIEKGYREIALVGGQFGNNDQAVDRYNGFMAAMSEAGRSVRPDLVISVPTPTTMESGRDVMLDLMARRNPPDAVFFHAEIPAHGAYLACLSQGISIPETVAIAGFGDLKLSPLLPVPMTTVKIKSEEIGRRAAECVVARLRGEDEEAGRMVDVGYEIMIRESA